MASKDQVRVGGKLELDVLLNAKNLDKQVKSLLAKIDDSKKSFGPADDTLNQAKSSLRQAEALLSQSSKATRQFIAGEKKFFEFNSKQRKQISKDLEGVSGAVKNAKSAYNDVNTAAKQLADSPKLQGELNKAYKEGLGAVRKLEQTNNALLKASNPVLQKAKEKAALAKSETEADRKRVAAKKVEAARLTQKVKEETSRKVTGKSLESISASDIQGFNSKQKAAVSQALQSRLKTAQEGQAFANKFGDSAESIARADKAVLRAQKGLQAYTQLQDKSLKLSQKSAEVEGAYRERDQAQIRQAKKDAEIFRAEQTKRAEAEKQQLQAVRARYKAEEKARADRVKAEEKAGEEIVRKQNQQVEDSLKDRQKAEDAARRKGDKIGERRRQEAQREVEKQARASQARVTAIRTQQQRVSQKGAIAGDIFRGYGAKGFKDIDFRTVQRQDLKGLQDYANELQKLALMRKNAARQQGASQSAINRTTAAYERQTVVVRELAHRYRQLHHPLQQVSLLFRQFFRFAIGYGVLYQALGAITALVKGVADLDEQLKSIQAITASTNKDMRSLETTIKRVAVTTKFTTNEIAAATQILGQAGVVASELPSALQATADFAAATGSQLAIAADLVTTTRNVFKELDDNTLADQLTKAINISKLTAEDLKTILSLGAQTARSYNLTSEQFLSAVTTLRNAGIKASTVATGLRQGLLEVFSPDASTVTALKTRYRQLGDVVTEEVVRQRFFGFTKADNPLLAVLTELKRLGFADDAQKEFQRAFDIRAANAIKALIRNFDELAAAEAKITFGLSAAEAANIQMSSLNNSLKNLGAAFTVLGDQIGGDAVESLESYTDGLTDVINKLSELDIKLKEQGKAGLGSAFAPLLGGALAGGFAGRGVKGKILGTVAGGAAGAAFGTGEGLPGVLGGAGLLGLLGFNAGRDLYGAGKSAKDSFSATGQGQLPLGSQGLKGKLVGALARTGPGRLVLSLAPAIGPIIGLVFTFLTFLTVFSDILSKAKTPAEEAANRVKGAQARLDNTQAELDRLQTFADEFDLDAASEGQIEGKAANTVAGLRESLESINDSIGNIFGNLEEDAERELLGLLQEYASATEAGRLAIKPEIDAIAGSRFSDEEFDRIVFTLGTDVKNLKGETVATVGQFNKLFSTARETIVDAVNSGDASALETDEAVNAENLLSVLDLDSRFRQLLRGEFDPLSEEAIEVTEELTRAVGASTSEAIDAYKKKVGVELEKAVTFRVQSAITAALANDKIKLEDSVDDLMETAGLSATQAVDYLNVLQEVFQQEVDRIAANNVDLQNFLKTRARIPIGPAATIPAPIPLALREAGNEFASASPILEAAIPEIAAEAESITEGVNQQVLDRIKQDQAVIAKFAKIIDTDSGRAELLRQGGAIGGVVGGIVEDILAAPSDAAETLEDRIGDYLTPESYSVNDKGLVRYTKAAEDLDNTLTLLTDVYESTNATLEGEKRFQKLQQSIPQVSDLIKVDKVDAEIRRISSEARRGSFGNKDLVESLLNSKKEAQRRILLATLKGVEIEVEKVAGENDAKKSSGTITKADAENLSRLQKRIAELRSQLGSLDKRTLEQIERTQNELERSRIRKTKEVQETSIEVAERWIELAGATGNRELLDAAIAQIDAARKRLRDEIRNELILENFAEEDSDLFNQELQNREEQLRAFSANGDEMVSAMAQFTSGIREQAALLRSQPITLGRNQDAISASFGTVGNERRFQEAFNNFEGAANEINAAVTQRDAIQGQVDSGSFTRPEDLVTAQNEIERLNQEITTLGQETSLLTLRMMENHESAEVRAQAELIQIGNVQSMIEALEDSDHAFKNFAENLRENLLAVIDDVSSALVGVILDGDDFKDAIGNVLNNLGRKLLEDGINTLVTEGATKLLSLLPDQIGGALSGAVGGVAEGAATATAVTAALTPATVGLQTANTQMFLAGTGLNQAAIGLNAAAIALKAAAATSGASDAASGIGSIAGAAAGGAGNRRGGVLTSSGIRRFSGGGILKGPGTGTSDSIPAFHVNGKKMVPIRVANGESILTAKATELLGEDFIHAMNSGRIDGFNTGGVASRGEITASGAAVKEVAGQAPPTVNNKNETTIVNAIDSSSVVAAGLETPAGGRAIFNFLKANKSKVQRIIQ